MSAKVLLVDDDEKMRRALATWLSYAGFSVTQAASGEEAIDVLERDLFAVVITDIVMGDVDGIEVLHTARRLPYRPSVILLTGHGSLETAMAAVRVGAQDYLLKPCDEEVLLACVQKAAKRYLTEQRLREAAHALALYTQDVEVARATPTPSAAPQLTTNILQIGSITIGASRKHVWFNARPVQLTPIEYALLAFLAQGKGQVHRYSAIVRHTHQLELDDAEAKGLLRTHFLNLRKKLDPGYFVTDRGIGYMMIEPEQHVEQSSKS